MLETQTTPLSGKYLIKAPLKAMDSASLLAGSNLNIPLSSAACWEQTCGDHWFSKPDFGVYVK